MIGRSVSGAAATTPEEAPFSPSSCSPSTFTAADHREGLQTTAQPPPLPTSRPQFIERESSGFVPPEVVVHRTPTLECVSPGTALPAYVDQAPYNHMGPVYAGHKSSVLSEPPWPDQPPPSRWYKYRKLLLILGIVIVVLSVVGGVVGGVVGSRSMASSGAAEAGAAGPATTTGPSTAVGGGTDEGAATYSSPSSSSATRSTATSPTATASFSGRPLSMAVSVSVLGSLGAAGVNSQVFLQKNDGGPSGRAKTVYRIYVGGKEWGPETDVDLDLMPPPRGPMASASKHEPDGTPVIQLFYLDPAQQDGSVAIVMALLRCIPLGNTCVVSGPHAVSSREKHKVHPKTGLAAIWVGGESSARVYYHTTDGAVAELRAASSSSSSEWDGDVVGVNASEGSNLAATYTHGPRIHVFFAAKDSGLPQVAVNDNGWQSPSAVDPNGKPSNWEPTSQFTAAYEDRIDLFRFVYASTAGQISEYRRKGSQSTYESVAKSDIWLATDGAVSAIGFDDNFNMYYTNRGKLTQSHCKNGTWKSTTAL